MKKFTLLTISLLLISLRVAASPAETATGHYLDRIAQNPQELSRFLYQMPKGGDLHHHSSGSTFAEKMFEYAANDGLCINRSNFVVSADSQCQPENLLTTAIKNPDFYDSLIDAWSMQHFQPGKESGHDHFFSTFGKFSALTQAHHSEIIAEFTERAAEQNVSYVETMLLLDNNASGKLGKQLGYDPDFAKMRTKLLANHLDDIIAGMSTHLDDIESKQRAMLQCGTAAAKPGCQVEVRYQYEILREQPPEMVFAQLLAGFEGARKEKRLVGINMVMPEDGTISMRDYQLHMNMINYLHDLYPEVHITLHAGELTNAIAAPEGLKFHINSAVNIAHAERIGHGVDIANEDDYESLLQKMADQQVMVEINLSSNAKILNVSGSQHPLPLYMQYGVPVALSTDDEGVSRDIMTTQYIDAVTTYHLNYRSLKNIVRNSLTYSFLPGENLWQDKRYRHLAADCKNTQPGTAHPNMRCQQFLLHNQKAALQWDLEQRFTAFENGYGN